MTLQAFAHPVQNLFGVLKMLRKLIDRIPTLDPEFGDNMITLALAFVAGFVIAMFIFID